jgi:hypothetical protein
MLPPANEDLFVGMLFSDYPDFDVTQTAVILCKKSGGLFLARRREAFA